MVDDRSKALERALINAHNAGDTDAAKSLAVEIKRTRAPSNSTIGGALDSFSQGAAFGFGDEITAAESAVLGRTPDGGWFDYSKPIGERYSTALEAERGQQNRFEQESPEIAIPAEIAGALTTGIGAGRAGLTMAGKGATTLGNIGRGAAEGLGYGMAYGFGEGEGGVASRSENALSGGLTGAAAGGALGGLADKAGRAFARARASREASAAGMSPGVTRVLGRAAEADDIAKVPDNIRAAGPDGFLAEGGDALGHQLDAAVNKSVAGAGLARGRVSERVETAANRFQGLMDETFGKVGQSSSRDLIVYGDKTNPISLAYRQAYSQPIDYASTAGRQIEDLVARVPKGEIDAANRLIRMDPDAVDVKQILARELDDGSIVFEELPTVQQLDYLTRALNGVADANIGKGALGGNTTTGRAYGNLSGRIRTALKEAVPDYAKALNAAGTEIGKVKARDIGANILRSRITTAEAQEALRDMPSAELGKVREGIREYIDHVAATAKRNATNTSPDAKEFAKGLSELSSPLSRRKLALILGEKEGARVTAEIDQLWKALELQGRIARGSATAVRTSVGQEVAAMTAPGPMRQLMAGRPMDATRDVVSALTGQTREAHLLRQDKVHRELVDILTKARGEKAAQQSEAIVKALQSRAPSKEDLIRMLQKPGASPATVGGNIGAMLGAN